MGVVEYYPQGTPAEPIRLTDQTVLDPAEFGSAARALITVHELADVALLAASGTDKATATHAISALLQVEGIVSDRADVLAEALMTKNGSWQIARRIGYVSRALPNGRKKDHYATAAQFLRG